MIVITKMMIKIIADGDDQDDVDYDDDDDDQGDDDDYKYNFKPSFHVRYDTGKDKFIDFEELKHMMEKLQAPQTHLSLKAMIKEVDEDQDGKISFREVCILLYCSYFCSHTMLVCIKKNR